MINYWIRLITGNQTKLSYIMYQCLLNLDQNGVYSSPWLNHIRGILNDCGMSGFWIAQDVGNPEWFKKAVEQRLRDQWITSWYSNLENKSICFNYKLFKDTLCIEEYLIKLCKRDRISICKLRACNNQLPVITGRYRNIERENRICGKCNCNVVGDEYHVLFVCSNREIVQLRHKYILPYYRHYPTQFKYIQLMKNTNVKLMENLAKFLRAIFNLFR